MKTKFVLRGLALGAIGTLGACTPAQIATVTQDVAKIQAGLNLACQDVQSAESLINAFGASMIPQVVTIEGFASGACVAGQATGVLVSKALSDPNTQAWTQNLAVMLRGLVSKL